MDFGNLRNLKQNKILFFLLFSQKRLCICKIIELRIGKKVF